MWTNLNDKLSIVEKIYWPCFRSIYAMLVKVYLL